jgi:membrane-associated phospholipid phosphatase
LIITMEKNYRKSRVLLLAFLCTWHCVQGQSPDTLKDKETVTAAEDSSLAKNKSCNTDTPQHVYRMNYRVSGPFCAVATAADIYAIPKIIKSKKDLTEAEVNAINPNVLNGMDRWALHQNLDKRNDYYKASDLVLPAIIVATGALMADTCIRKDWFRLLIMYYEMHAITFSIYNFSFFGPAFQNKYRPLVYYTALPEAARKGGNQRNSMYSGHTATAVASTFFMVKVYSDYHPELGQKKYLLYALASVPPLMEGYLRVKALAHFPSDVLIGFSIGAACGIIMPSLHKFHNQNLSVGVCPTPVGPGIGATWNIQPKVAVTHGLSNVITAMPR